MKRLLIVFTSVCMMCACGNAADIVTLNNKMTFEGKVTRIKKCEVVFKTTEGKYVIPASEIFSIQFADVQDHVYLNYIESKDINNCMKGRFDAETLHGKRTGHFFLGVLFGPFALLGTAISNPTPNRGKDTYALSPNKDLFTDPEYISCYKKRAKGILLGMEAAGWGALILFITIVSATSTQ